MAEYIEREKAFELVTDLAGQASTKSAYSAFWKAANALKEMPTADVVEVVRCKECKHAYINSFSAQSGVALCKFWSNRAEGNSLVVQRDDFCSYGERKGEGE